MYNDIAVPRHGDTLNQTLDLTQQMGLLPDT